MQPLRKNVAQVLRLLRKVDATRLHIVGNTTPSMTHA
jgi:hypothetical protein